MKPGRAALVLLVGLAWLSGRASAQEVFADLFPRNLEALLQQVFGSPRAFTARAHITITDEHHLEVGALRVLYVYRGGLTRTEADLATIKSPDMSPDDVATLTQMGLAQAVEIFRPDKDLSYLVFPTVRAWCEATDGQPPPPRPDAKARAPQIEKTKIGKATVDRHPCTQSKLTITSLTGEKTEVTTWEATDLNDFPVQVQFPHQGSTVTVHFRDVDQTRPDAWLFEPPAGYKHYRTVEELIQSSTPLP